MFFHSLVVAAIVSVAAAGDCVRQYIVQPGDYCDKISASNNVSTYQLAAINSGINDKCTDLVPYESICLGGPQGEDCQTVYTVVKGDTCDAISAAHQINTTILHENNPQINPDCSNIYIGEVLCVANSVKVPPPTSGKSYPMPSTATPAVPSKTPTPANSNDDEDDDSDLPYCDEL